MLSCRPTGIHAAWQWLHNSTQKYTSNTSFEFFSVAFWCFKASLPLQPSQLGLFLIVKASNDERAALVQSAFLALNISGSGYLSESEMEPLAICTGISVHFISLFDMRFRSVYSFFKHQCQTNISSTMEWFIRMHINYTSTVWQWLNLVALNFLRWAGLFVCGLDSFSCQTQVCLGQSRSGENSLICWERNASKLHETVRDMILRKLLGSQRRNRSIVCERFSVPIRPLANK